MSSDTFDVAEKVFLRALALPSQDRAFFVDHECCGDAQLRDHVNQLFRDDERADREAFLECRIRTLPTPVKLDSVDLSCESTITRIGPSDDEASAPRETGGQLSPPPEMFGRYKPLRRIGVGGFCEVWEAMDTKLERLVALKTPRADRPSSPRILQSLQSEAKKLAGMDFTGIVRIYDVGEHAGTSFIVSELRRGGTLANRLASGGLSFQESVDLVSVISQSLHFAHTKGLVHRDVKPANILYDEHGNPALADFGLAVTEQEQLTEGRCTLGTITYMAPEQARGDSKFASPRADIFSLGVVFYECLTGRLPFAARTLGEYREQLLHREPKAPSLINTELPHYVDAICLKCLAKSPSERFATARDLAGELAKFGPSTQGNRHRRSSGRLLVLCAMLIAVLGLFLFVGRNQDEAHPKRHLAEDLKESYPLELPWTLRDALTTEVLANGDALRIAAEGSGWLSFGELDQRMVFRVEVSQHKDAGRIGVFQQFKTGEPREDAQFYYFLLIAVDQGAGDKFEVSSRRVRIAKQSGRSSVKELARTPLSQWHAHGAAIELIVTQNEVMLRVDSSNLDKAFLESTASALHASFPKSAYTGHFGLWFDDCQARLALPMVDGQRRNFDLR